MIRVNNFYKNLLKLDEFQESLKSLGCYVWKFILLPAREEDEHTYFLGCQFKILATGKGRPDFTDELKQKLEVLLKEHVKDTNWELTAHAFLSTRDNFGRRKVTKHNMYYFQLNKRQYIS